MGLRIMTSNIWGDYFNNPVGDREDLLLGVFERFTPDVLGLQEVTKSWYGSSLLKRLSEGYAFAGTESYENTNFVPMAYKKDLLLLAKGYERLSGTKDRSKAITWAVLMGPETWEKQQVFAVCNTHFWWKSGPEHDAVRKENAKQLAALMGALHQRYDCPVFAFGDMNTVLTSEVFQVYEDHGIHHLYDLAEQRTDVSSHHGDPAMGPDGRLHGKKTQKDRRSSIDHMIGLGDGYKILKYQVVEDQDALDASDHSPVYVDVEFF